MDGSRLDQGANGQTFNVFVGLVLLELAKQDADLAVIFHKNGCTHLL